MIKGSRRHRWPSQGNAQFQPSKADDPSFGRFSTHITETLSASLRERSSGLL